MHFTLSILCAALAAALYVVFTGGAPAENSLTAQAQDRAAQIETAFDSAP